MIHFDNETFIIQNQHVCYIMHLLRNKHLAHVYYGHPLKGDVSSLFHETDKQAGTCKFYKEDHFFSLADQMLEYPVYGSTDFKQGALVIEKESQMLFLNLVYDHYECQEEKTSLLPHSNGVGETLKIVLKDNHYGIEVDLFYTLYVDSPVIVRYAHIKNIGKQTYHLKKAMSAVLNLRDDDYTLVHFGGNWGRERMMHKQNLTQGQISVESLYGSSSHQSQPGIMLEGQESYSTNLIYSGNFLTVVDVNEWGMTRVMTGIHPFNFDYLLQAGDCFETPEAILSMSAYGLEGLSQVNHHFINNHIIPKRFRKKPMPIVLNSWEAFYFDYQEDDLLKLAKKAKDVGIECFVVDDGWFAHRNNDRTSLGDWMTNKDKFPKGLGHLSQSLHEMGLQFGLWIEPEMVSEDSQFYKNHPDYVIGDKSVHRSYGRSQLVLDFANPHCVDAIFNQLKDIIDETHPDYIKWDMNRDITEPYSCYLQKHNRPQGELFHRYILGVYDLYRRLTNYAPDMLIEGCAGGGGRFDMGILCFSPMIWVSDDSDAIERLTIQNNTSYLYPLRTLSNHVSIVPNHQTNRITPLQTRYHVACFGSLGYELDLYKLNSQELDEIKNQIVMYKKYREAVLAGTFHRLVMKANEEIIWALETPHDLFIGFFKLLAHLDTHPQKRYPLNFVDENAQYQDTKTNKIYDGTLLKYAGLAFPSARNGINNKQALLKGDFSSCLIHLHKI